MNLTPKQKITIVPSEEERKQINTTINYLEKLLKILGKNEFQYKLHFPSYYVIPERLLNELDLKNLIKELEYLQDEKIEIELINREEN